MHVHEVVHVHVVMQIHVVMVAMLGDAVNIETQVTSMYWKL